MQTSLTRKNDYYAGSFMAMASPCDILMDTDDEALAGRLLDLAQTEARRIEHKFSRYRDDNIIHDINNSRGKQTLLDEETANLIDYAQQCYELSNGKFDITSGVLRQVWKFDGSDRLPTKKQVNEILQCVGWEKVTWEKPNLSMPQSMEIDLGGIGKEYAVDKTALILTQASKISLLINFGGDLYTTGRRSNGQCWHVGVDDPNATGQQNIGNIELETGAIATSGDARRFLLKDGIRYSHILNPKTGWPVPNAPHSVTVIANTCLEAGMLATFAMLEGANADTFLKQQNVPYQCVFN